MLHRLIPLLLAGLLAGCRPAADAGAPAAAPAPLPVLGVAPAWEARDLQGKAVRWADLQGKVVVIDFWATWCPPCRQEIPGYIDLARKYAGEGLVIVGVSLDQAGVGVVQGFAAKAGINYPLVMGDDELVAAFGGVEALPTTFLIDRQGRVRHRKVGAEPAETYERRVLAVLRERP